MWLVIGIISFMINVFGKSINFEWKVDLLWIFWIYKGKIILVLIIVMLVMLDKMVVIVKIFDLKMCSFKKGCFKCNCWYVKRYKIIVLIIKNL